LSDCSTAGWFAKAAARHGTFGASSRAGKRMASKVNLMKFFQEVRGYDLVTNRRPPPRLNGACLQSHARGTESRLPARRKLAVTVHPADVSNTPKPVKILQVAAR
jgi:hypothetical protein